MIVKELRLEQMIDFSGIAKKFFPTAKLVTAPWRQPCESFAIDRVPNRQSTKVAARETRIDSLRNKYWPEADQLVLVMAVSFVYGVSGSEAFRF